MPDKIHFVHVLTPCSYFYISIMYNVCYTFALYGLLLFWIGAEDLLKPYKPLLKFLIVKTVVFLTFWQVGNTRDHVGPIIHAMGSSLKTLCNIIIIFVNIILTSNPACGP